jgi:DUF1365 family protein
VLVAHHRAQQRPLDDRELLRLALTHPLLTLKVIAGIHWEALKLLIKGLRLYTHPARQPGSTPAVPPSAAAAASASAASALHSGS